MRLNISYNFEGRSLNEEVELPDNCPTCGRLIPFPFNGADITPISGELQTVHQCTYQACKSHMICYHTRGPEGWVLRKTEPTKLTETEWPDFVKDVSSDFVSIHKEAVEAEDRGLQQIAGPGYRKAFEFLIKDYAKKKAANDLERVEKLLAGDVVNEFIQDPRVQAVAKRALWIGNDETHYLRKWEDKDINDLKILIRLTIEWIDIERQSAAYIEEMPEAAAKSGKPSK